MDAAVPAMPYGFGAKEKIAEASRDVDAAIMNGDVEDCVLESPNLKWIHCCRDFGVPRLPISEP